MNAEEVGPLKFDFAAFALKKKNLHNRDVQNHTCTHMFHIEVIIHVSHLNFGINLLLKTNI